MPRVDSLDMSSSSVVYEQIMESVVERGSEFKCIQGMQSVRVAVIPKDSIQSGLKPRTVEENLLVGLQATLFHHIKSVLDQRAGALPALV